MQSKPELKTMKQYDNVIVLTLVICKNHNARFESNKSYDKMIYLFYAFCVHPTKVTIA